jgi:hypothetical protein
MKYNLGDRVYVIGLITNGYGTIAGTLSHGYPVMQYYKVEMDNSSFSRDVPESGLMLEREKKELQNFARL